MMDRLSCNPRLRIAAPVLLCLGLAACGGASEPEATQQPVAHKAVDSERYSGVADARTVVIADAAAWAALWEEHTRERDPVPRAPAVDFSQQMVLGVFIGQRPDSCSAVNVQKVYRANGRLVVEYAEPPADPAAACTAITTHPSQLVVVPRGPGPVDFVKATAR
jgi:hypothetical protein